MLVSILSNDITAAGATHFSKQIYAGHTAGVPWAKLCGTLAHLAG